MTAASRVTLAISLLAFALSGCLGAGPPPAGGEKQKQVVLDTGWDDAKFGGEASKTVEAQVGVVKDEKLRAYLQSLGTKLVRFAPAQPFSYEFEVVDQWSPNAFALPGGHIFVSRGLLVLTNTEDELACVVGHEITHAAERHAASRQAFSSYLPPFALGVPRMLTLAAYARDQERNADVGGQRICAAAGYDPHGLSTFLQSLDLIERMQMGSSRIPTFLDTHPGTPERIGSAAVYASTLPARPRDPAAGPGGREKYLRHFEGLLLGADPREGVIQGSRFLQPDLGIAVTFPAGWEVVNTPVAVIAVSQKRDARFALEDAGEGSDPRAVAEPYLKKRLEEVRARVDHQGEQQTRCCKTWVVRGEVQTERGVIAGQIAWLALGGRVYRLSSAYVPIVSEKYNDRAKQFVRSFRAIADEERKSITVNRLALVRAKAGETIAALSARTGNVYEAHPTAIANGVTVDTVLAEGQLMKIGVKGPYLTPAAASAGR